MNSEVTYQSSSAAHVVYAWRRSLVILLLSIATILFFYSNTVIQMVRLWSVSETYAHGFIVPFISFWLIWRIRGKWMALNPKNSWSALLLMLGFSGLWLAGDLVAVNAITQLALVSMIVLSVPVLFGWQIAGAMAFPLFFLYFSVPIGDFMLPIMMEWTADFTVIALRFTGIPVYREGLQFVIPSGNWSVVEACSGIRYLIASVMVGCLFSYINYRTYAKRLAFIAVSIAVPLIANWLRAYLIVLIGHYSGNELASGVDHLIYGWLFFGLVIGIMLFVGARWADEPVLMKKDIQIIDNKYLTINNNHKLISMLIVVVAAPHFLKNWFELKNRELPVNIEQVMAVAPWEKMKNSPIDWTPGFLHAAAQSNMGFRDKAGTQVGLHISYYRQQNYKSKLVTSTNKLVSDSNKEWTKISSKNQEIKINNETLQFNNSVLRHKGMMGNEGNQRLQIWHLYWVNGKLIANDMHAKIQGALGRITGQGDDGAIVAIYIPYKSTESSEKDLKLNNEILQNFVILHKRSIISTLQKTRDKN